MGLFKPVWMSKYEKLQNHPAKMAKAIAYVNTLRDPDLLFQIVKEATHDDVRMAAVSLIDDPAKLYDIAVDRYTSKEVAEAAAGRIQDDETLEAVAKNADKRETRAFAAGKIRGQERLMRIALNADEFTTAERAAAHITDPAMLLELAMSETRHAENAAKRIDDDAALNSIAVNAPLCTARRAALLRVDDVPVLIEAIQKDDDESNRLEAFLKINWLVSSQDRHLTENQSESLVEYLKQHPDEREALRLKSKKPGFPHELFDKVFDAAVEADRQGTSFLQTVWQAPEEQLPDMWLKANERCKFARGSLEKPWRKAREEIGRRIERSNNFPMQMTVVRNAAFGKFLALNAIRRLFYRCFDDMEGIAALREEALNAYVDHIPSFPEEGFQCMFDLTHALPKEALDQYGFETSVYEQEEEDQFGRYTYDITTINFRGRGYRNNP